MIDFLTKGFYGNTIKEWFFEGDQGFGGHHPQGKFFPRHFQGKKHDAVFGVVGVCLAQVAAGQV